MEEILRQLKASKVLYEQFFHEHPKPSCVFTSTGKVEQINKAFSTLLGYSPEGAKGKHYSELIAPHTLFDAVNAYQKTLRGEQMEMDLSFLTYQGERVEARTHFFPISEGQNTNGIFAQLEDLSSFRSLQKLTHGQNQILSSMTKNNPMDSVMQEIISLFEDITGGHVVILSGSEQDNNITLYTCEGQFFDFPLLYDDRMKQVTLSQNIQDDARWDYHRKLLKRKNFESGCVFPVFNDNKEWVGAFCLFFPVINALSDKTLDTIKEGGYLTSIAFQHYRSKEQIHFLAFHDPLTGLPNRRLFDKKLKEVYEQARIEKQTFSVLFIDLDRFKIINDTYGHQFGDEFLEEVAKRIDLSVRKDDLVSRRGGDEFTVLLQNASFETAGIIASRIVGILEAPFLMDGIEVSTSPSIGIGIFPHHGNTLDELLQRADEALYQAKKNGGNMYKFHDDALEEQLQEKIQIEKHLRQALKNNELSLHYQPKVSLQTEEVVGMEALLRWYSPSLGQVTPTKFIPIAEETGLIIPIGLWVFEQVCLQLKKWEDTMFADLSISVNLSMKQFFKPTLIPSIEQLLTVTQINPARLEIEITESMTMDVEVSKRVLNDLKSLGFQVSIDDFGTGYSSMSYLKHFPIDIIKVDRSFLTDMSPGSLNRNILNAIFVISKALGYQTVAEGVETVEQIEVLKTLECDLVQGFCFSKPLPIDECEVFCKKRIDV